MAESKAKWRRDEAFRLIWEAGSRGITRTQIRDILKSDMADIAYALWLMLEEGKILPLTIPRGGKKSLHILIPGPNAAQSAKELELGRDDTPAEPKSVALDKTKACKLKDPNGYGKCYKWQGHDGEHSYD